MKVLFYIALSVLLAPVTGYATTVKSFAFDGLCETAKTIVHVRCTHKESLMLPGRDGIFTQFNFDVVEVVKGQAEQTLVLVLPGGKLNGLHTEIPGMPQFVVGQETVLFLSDKDANGSPWPVGLGQGCFGVRVGEDGVREVVLGAQNPADPTLRSKPSVQKKVGLQVFMNQIRGVLKTEKPGAQPTQ